MSDNTIPEDRSVACIPDRAMVVSRERRECLSSATGAAVTAVVVAGFLMKPGTAMAGCGASSKHAEKAITTGYDGEFVLSISKDTGIVILGSAGAFAAAVALGASVSVAAGIAGAVMIVGHTELADTMKTALAEELDGLRSKMAELTATD